MTRRSGLWATLLVLIALLLVALVWLVGRYEQSRLEEELDRSAQQLASTLRHHLERNSQRLQLLSQRPELGWQATAQTLLEAHPEMLRIELRSPDLTIQRVAHSLYIAAAHPDGVFQQFARAQFATEVKQSCTLASGYGEAAYSPSYFVPQGAGLGLEVTDFCLPLSKNVASSGFVVVTYSLQGMLKEWTTQSQQRLQESVLEEPDGSRLAVTGQPARQGARTTAHRLLDLQGLTLVVRVSRWFSTPHWMANTPTALVLILAVALGVVLWLLQRDMRKRRRTEVEFRQSQDRLQRSARLASLGEMASLLSHELNQPLAAIASYAAGSLHLMESEPHALDLFEIKTALERIATQSQRAGVVIKSINDFVRRRDTERMACAPQDLLAGILPLLSLQTRQLGIRLSWQLQDDLPQVWCDKTLIEQVILNLARNGIQSIMAVPEGTLGLRQLGLHVFAQANAQVCFVVEDTGVGITPDVATKLFTPFFTTKAEGTGLGLSLCRTVIEQHGSHLSYTSEATEDGFVTRFTFSLGTHDSRPYHQPT